MIVYFDTSAVVPLLVDEPGSSLCAQLWDDSDDVVTSILTYVETTAALAQAQRMGRLDDVQRREAAGLLESLWDEFAVVAVDDELARRAAGLAVDCGLRGYDAVHCASALQVAADDLVVASGDRSLLRACRKAGLATADTASGE
ncbi:type II toxin-antitoxin system VapC family toxin [Amycolatopsis suaedae]|uniref:Ribonuclease VapC n=1 Tax=Amycolatopsis suaedae TaxID=2510978 RepID=A0A4V2EL75_9PSEU|nr:type II toxin-antitoxin system VapC family toxin [Amycolatopsis suaedae]RZQ60585.1 PIN domain-containing protein [Amycolatopsis suaedae]